MKNNLIALILAGVMMFALAACGNSEKSAEKTDETSASSVEDSEVSEQATSEVTEKTKNPSSDEADDQGYIDGTELFAELSKYEFEFCSGAGGWATDMTIDAHANVEGHYHDSEMGDIGDTYPNGTVYVSDFTTTLTNPIREGEYGYKLTVATDIICEKDYDSEEIIDGVRYVYTAPYGINYNTIHIYMKGAPVSELPEEFLNWMYGCGALDRSETELPFIGLYVEDPECEEGGYGWSSYEL